jgi:hypothetical protein
MNNMSLNIVLDHSLQSIEEIELERIVSADRCSSSHTMFDLSKCGMKLAMRKQMEV